MNKSIIILIVLAFALPAICADPNTVPCLSGADQNTTFYQSISTFANATAESVQCCVAGVATANGLNISTIGVKCEAPKKDTQCSQYNFYQISDASLGVGYCSGGKFNQPQYKPKLNFGKECIGSNNSNYFINTNVNTTVGYCAGQVFNNPYFTAPTNAPESPECQFNGVTNYFYFQSVTQDATTKAVTAGYCWAGEFKVPADNAVFQSGIAVPKAAIQKSDSCLDLLQSNNIQGCCIGGLLNQAGLYCNVSNPFSPQSGTFYFNQGKVSNEQVPITNKSSAFWIGLNQIQNSLTSGNSILDKSLDVFISVSQNDGTLASVLQNVIYHSGISTQNFNESIVPGFDTQNFWADYVTNQTDKQNVNQAKAYTVNLVVLNSQNFSQYLAVPITFNVNITQKYAGSSEYVQVFNWYWLDNYNYPKVVTNEYLNNSQSNVNSIQQKYVPKDGPFNLAGSLSLGFVLYFDNSINLATVNNVRVTSYFNTSLANWNGIKTDKDAQENHQYLFEIKKETNINSSTNQTSKVAVQRCLQVTDKDDSQVLNVCLSQAFLEKNQTRNTTYTLVSTSINGSSINIIYPSRLFTIASTNANSLFSYTLFAFALVAALMF